VNGWFSDGAGPAGGASFTGITPNRIVDTRDPASTIATMTAGDTRLVATAGRGGVPATARAVVANITVTDTSGAGYLTAYPSAAAAPLASDLNFSPGGTVPNLVVVQLGPDGNFSVSNAGGRAALIVDVVGYYD
jgi:hypothetical protein